MSWNEPFDAECHAPNKRRSPSGASITNAYSAKRRRISLASVDLEREIRPRPIEERETERTVADRFVPSRPRTSVPLNVTPRTDRIARMFGLLDDRVLNYAESSTFTPDPKAVNLQRISALPLYSRPTVTPPTSAASNIGTNKQFLLALDGPGIPHDIFASPLSWSLKNYIAVACGKSVYYQNLNTRSISCLCKLSGSHSGRLHSIEWAGANRPDTLALGTTHGTVQMWDAISEKQLVSWPDAEWRSVGGMNWYEDSLAVGRSDGRVVFYDARSKRLVRVAPGHKDSVPGVRWSADGNYLASGDDHGSVFIWDMRAEKHLVDAGKKGPKMKHRGPVKALSWCPWKPDLLATGSMFPEGTIRIWSTNSTSSPPQPLHTVPLNTSVTSLHWSPHCKELLATHGASWVAPTTGALPTRLEPSAGPYVNSISVLAYPSCRKVVTVNAHNSTVGHSCLSPDGTKVFTICPAEEAMKMWKVWGYREPVAKRESVFDKCVLR